ncbi:LysR family transcriptional regulator [Cupriavidus respiraculi]|uniref:PCP degradation transcriptional activation protein n=1 Tax=Cupriavidus respiraculi TaxID=195930 RepID=A0ABM8WN51_9BURK|nr:LysR family transcriptional regulator [Cupriavidus respiraculi]MBY4947290.1 LysR family transcriptional regulator [Cupriavidus respiraculi]CAG9168821.1 PCP degradation transcriptional activation protein [Cupriavidus respiraculi]
MERGDNAPDADNAQASRRLPLADLRKRDLNLLVVLAALLESQSVSDAAKRLDSTQPSTSRMLERLRDELGDPLLIKSALKMLPTRRAQELRPVLETVLRQIEEIYNQAARYDPALETGSYAIGINDSLQAVIAPDFLLRLRDTAPRARVRMQPVPMPSGVGALASGAIDVMVAFHPVAHESLRSEPLFNAQFGLLCAADHPDIGARPTPQQLAPLPCLDISQFGLVTRLIDRYFADHGCQRAIVGTLTSYLAVADAVAGTNLYAMVPGYLAPLLCRHPGVRFCPVESPLLSMPVHLCWHNNVHTHPFVSVLRTLLTQSAARLAA